MDTKTNYEQSALIRQAITGDKAALETVLESVQELVFNLSLRMLGTFPDAEDASQDNSDEGHDASVLLQGRQLLLHLGISYRVQPSEFSECSHVFHCRKALKEGSLLRSPFR